MKKTRSLKIRIILWVTIILIVCSALIIIFENVSGKIKEEFSDKSMVRIFDNVRQENEQFHIRRTSEELQNFAMSENVIAYIEGERTNSTRLLVSGLFITLSKSIGVERLVLLDKKFNMIFSEKTGNSFSEDKTFSSEVIRERCKNAGETWENQGACIRSSGKVVFILVTAVINDDDDVVGYAACELSVKRLAKSFSDIVQGQIGFENADHGFTGTSDDEFFRQLPKEGVKQAQPGVAFVRKITSGDPAPSQGEKADSVQTPNDPQKASGTLFYKFFPIEVKNSEECRYRYWVGLEYTTPAKVKKRLALYEPLVLGGVLVMGILLLFLLLSRVIKPLETVVKALKDIAQGEGDLTRRIEVDVQNEIGELAKWFNSFVERLKQIVVNVGEQSNVVSDASDELLHIAEKLDKSADDLSSRAGAVAGASEEMSQSMSSVAAAGEQASTNLDSVASAAGTMRAGLGDVTQNCTSASHIADEASSQVESASNRVGQLGSAARDIGKVVEVITEIADQTNLLALNATIEAARAGDAGKGFAVVAEEIKGLASQTARATLEISEKITGIQGSTDNTVSDVEKITDIISKVSQIVSNISESIDAQSKDATMVAGNIEQASLGMGEVSENIASSSQSATAISDEIAGVSAIAGDIAKGSTAMNLSAKKLYDLSTMLKETIGVFKV